jgi:hypothetical protein
MRQWRFQTENGVSGTSIWFKGDAVNISDGAPLKKPA